MQNIKLVFAVGILTGALLSLLALHNYGAQAATPQTGIVSDEAAKTVKILIDGKEAAWFDATGLHVIHAIEYGDTITDTGPAYLEQRPGVAGAQ